MARNDMEESPRLVTTLRLRKLSALLSCPCATVRPLGGLPETFAAAQRVRPGSVAPTPVYDLANGPLPDLYRRQCMGPRDQERRERVARVQLRRSLRRGWRTARDKVRFPRRLKALEFVSQLGDPGIVGARVIPRLSFRSSWLILCLMKLHMDNCSSEAVMSTARYRLSSGLVRNWLQALRFGNAAARAQSCARSAVRPDQGAEPLRAIPPRHR